MFNACKSQCVSAAVVQGGKVDDITIIVAYVQEETLAPEETLANPGAPV